MNFVGFAESRISFKGGFKCFLSAVLLDTFKPTPTYSRLRCPHGSCDCLSSNFTSDIIMDHVNSDSQFDVPDTPNRLAAKDLNVRNRVSTESGLSTSGHSGYGNIAGEHNENRVYVNGVGKRRLFMRPPKSINSSMKSEFHANSSASGLGNSIPSRNGVQFTKVSSIPNSNEKYNLHLSKSENTDSKSQKSSQRNYPAIDLTKKSGSMHVFVKAPTVEAHDGGQVEKWRTRSAAMNEHSHLHKMTSFVPSSNANKGKETDGSSSKSHGEKDSTIDAQLGARKDGSASFANSPRVIGQKRLVRNGCISPHNIAKAKKPAVEEDKGVLTHGLTGNSLTESSAGTSLGIAKELISKNGICSTLKGKEVIMHSSPSKEHETTHPFSRSLISIDEKAKETNDFSRDASRSFDESGGWRSTRNRSGNMNFSLSNVHRTLDKDSACFITHSSGSRATRRDDASNGHDSASIRHVSGESAEPKESIPGPQCPQINGNHTALNTVKNRLKQGPASSIHGECSTSASDDLDIILLASPESRINRRSTRNRNHVGIGVEPVIDVDSPSSTTRHEGSRVVCSSSRNDDARTRQLEADERLARELQEQLYNEVPSFGVGEIDGDVALALAQEDLLHASSGGENQLSNFNGSLVANIRRRQSRNASITSRRASQARASSSNRMARLRSRFPGQPRTVSSSRGRNSLFPPNMDVDMRMHILETLEAFSNMDVDGSLLQTQRDFNENDYEMLLALDENNHQHGGASVRQINDLPQSTVQNESLQEACAVCLETPTVGDVIRHLPCLHKFHKDCIDPWLRRKTSCPVCKSSIT